MARFMLLVARMDPVIDDIDTLTEKVIGCAVEVHRRMGPGLTEPIYRECLLIELAECGLAADCEWPVAVHYRNRRLKRRFQIDLLVEKRLVVELKAVDALHPVHHAQMITYLKLTGCPAGLLLNFNEATLRAGLRRFDHPERYARKLGRIGRKS